MKYCVFILLLIANVTAMTAQQSTAKKGGGKAHKGVKYTTPVIRDTEVAPPPVQDEITDHTPANKTAQGGDEEQTDTTKPKEQFLHPDEEAQFPGGTDSLYAFIRNNIRYPEIAKEAGKSGKVYMSFEIDTEGNIVNIKVLRSPAPEFEKESIRCVKSMPKWVPAKFNHKSVRSVYYLPISFRLE